MGCFQIPRRHFNVFQLLCNLLFLGCSVLFIHFGIVLTQIHQTCETASAYVETSGEQLKSVHVCSAVLVTLYGVTLAVYAVFSFMINAACGLPNRIATFHIAFNSVLMVLSMVTLIKVGIFHHSILRYIAFNQDLCADAFKAELHDSWNPITMFLLGFVIIVHFGTPLMAINMVDFEIDWMKLEPVESAQPEIFVLNSNPGHEDRTLSQRN